MGALANDTGVRAFTRTAIVLHWLIAVLLLGQFTFGVLLDDIPRNTPARGYYINLHKSIGLLIGLLIVLRIGWRLCHAPPPLPPMAAWQRRAAAASHVGLYLCMALMPLSGYLASNFSRHGIKFFNVVRLAPWGSDDRALYALFNGIHGITAIVLAMLVGLHVLAVVKHTLIDRDRLLARMWRAAWQRR
jgi:cytochrome b561